MSSDKLVCKEVKKGLYWVGAINPDLRVFDIIMTTPYGTTYNSYILKGEKGTILFDTVMASRWSEFEARLATIPDFDGKIDYIVVSHCEPDHSGAMVRALKRWPDATVVATIAGHRNLKYIVHREITNKVIVTPKGSTSIDIGNFRVDFIVAPLLHWPDTMFSYIPELKSLVTCDFFGAHYAPPNGADGIFNDTADAKLDDMLDAYKYYFDCIMGPFKPYVLQGLSKIEALGEGAVDTICCSHGNIIRKDLKRYVDLYREWSTPTKDEEPPRVVIIYVSAYRYTKMLAETAAVTLRQDGFKVDIMDFVGHTTDEAVALIGGAKGLLLGTPTIVGEALTPIMDIATRINPIVHAGLHLGAFGSYGWSGEGVKNLQGRLLQLAPRCPVPLDGFSATFKPSIEELDKFKVWSHKFGEFITKANPNVALKPLPAPGPETKGRSFRWQCTICGEIAIVPEVPHECDTCCMSGPDIFEYVGYA